MRTEGRRIAGAVVLALGFRELGGDGERLEAELLQAARRTGVRVVGPNTSGILNLSIGLNLIGVEGVEPGPLGLLVQSGNTALSLLTEAAGRRGQGVSICVGVGNESDVAFHEYLAYLGQDEDTRAVLVYAEGFADGRAFLEVARRVVARKPVVVLKGGRSDAGSKAAHSHTGAIAGEYAALRAGLRQAGVIEVQRSDELHAVGVALAGQPPVRSGLGIAVLADGGGQATLAADALSQLDVRLARLENDTRSALSDLLGPASHVGNPLDVAGAGDREPAVFPAALELLLRDPAVGGVLVVGLFGGYAQRFAPELARREANAATALARAATTAGKPLVLHSIYADAGSEPVRVLSQRGVPVIRSVEVACRAIAALSERGRSLARQAAEPFGDGRGPAPRVLERATRERRLLLLEPEARELASVYGVPIAPARLCATATEAEAEAQRIGGPVALKVVSPHITHKLEAGGVALDVRGGERVREAFARIRDAVCRYGEAHGNDVEVHGVLVAPMLPPPVAEVLVGVRRDPQLGPVLTFGAGGSAVEVLRDVALRVLPISREDVLELMDEVRLAAVLRGLRGRPAADLHALSALIVGLSECALANPGIVELEANPVFAYPDRAVAVDVRAVRGEADAAEH